MSENPPQPLWTSEPQFDGLPVIKSYEELAERVKSANTISTLGPRHLKWRMPSRNSLLSLLESQTGAREQLQFYPEKSALVEELTGEISKTEAELERWNEQGRPLRPRLSPELTNYEDIPADQIAIVSGRHSLLFGKVGPLRQGVPLVRREGIERIPISLSWLGSNFANAIDFNLPHPLEAQCGTWRDWILGMKVMLADGTIVNTGSRAVKNVAGYDLHKLLIGARGTLGIILEVTVRTTPYDSLPKPELEFRYEQPPLAERWRLRKHLWLQRTRPRDFADAVRLASDAVLEIDWASSTFWATVPPDQELPRYEGDWILRSGCGKKNLEFTDPTQIALMRRAKDLFDPTHKLNPGEMGIF